jgi:hypothetical protein
VKHEIYGNKNSKRNEIIFEEFLSKIDETNIHDEISFGNAIERELL